MDIEQCVRARTFVRRDESGMSLLELMIAAGVMTIGFALLMGSIVSIATTSTVNQDRAVASAHLSTVMEQLQSSNFEQLMAYTAPALTGLSQESVVVDTFDTGGGTVTLPADPDALTSPLPNPYEVRVIVSWVDKMGRPNSVRASSMFRR